MAKYIWYLFCILFCICVNSCAKETYSPLFPCSKIIDNPYGVCAHFAHPLNDYPTQHEQMMLIKQAGIGNVRNDLWVPYNEHWKKHDLLPIIDSAVVRTKKSTLDFLGIVFVGWNKQRAWDRKTYYNEFLDYLLSKYKDAIPYWEVMNEVNMTCKEEKVPLDSTASYYMSLLPETYRKIKRANPKLLVTLSGLADVNDNFLDIISKKEAYHYFDIMNFHSYDVPEKMPDKYNMIKSIMDKYHWHKPVWITECGMPTHYDSIVKPWQIPNERREIEQACRLPRMYIISFAYGIDKVYTYKLRAKEKNKYYNEDHFGILHADLSPKPAYYAYKIMTQMLPSGSLRPTLTKSGNTYMSYWKRPDGKKVWALWNSHGNKKISINMKGKGQFYDYMGNKLAVSKELTVGKGVVYIVGAKSIRFQDSL